MQLGFTELRKHLQYDCKENRTCKPCNMEFNTLEEFQNHIKYSCQAIQIECSDCNQTMTRRDFRMHDCYVFKEYKKQEILDVLQKQPFNSEREFIEQQIRLENKKLLKEIEFLRETINKKMN